MLRRGWVWCVALCALLLLGQPTIANAAGPNCILNPLTGRCELSVTESKKWDQPGKNPGKIDSSRRSSCRFKGQVIPCSTEEGFWDAATGCYLKLFPPRTLGDLGEVPKTTRFYRCWKVFGVVDGRPDGEAVFETIRRDFVDEPVPTIDPREAARRVVETMDFVAPRLGLSPHVIGPARAAVVNVPVWMWVTDPGPTTTGPQTVTATAGGVSITATATLDRIDWSMGGGKVVTCRGAGTALDREKLEGLPLRRMPASPTCGHKYVKTSRCEPGKSFRVTATAFWNVHWTGGGTQGDIPLEFSRSTPLRVVELRPVLVDPDGSTDLPDSVVADAPCA